MTTPTSIDRQTDFGVSYDGPALANHTMQIRDLAPALLALGQAFERANTILNGDRATMSLEIRATQAGSFEMALLLKQLYDGGVAAFSSDYVSSAVNIKELFLGGPGGIIGLIALVKWLKGRRITTAAPQGPEMVIEVDNVRLTIPSELLKLAQDVLLRDQLAAVVRPLSRDGIDKVAFNGTTGDELASINKDEAHFFRVVEEDFDNVSTTVIPRQRLKPSTVNFMQQGKWRLSDGEKVRWYAMRDQTFSNDVQDGTVRLGAKDLFICEVLMKQSLSEAGDLRMEYEITSVIDHIQPGQQARMLDNGGGIAFPQADDGTAL